MNVLKVLSDTNTFIIVFMLRTISAEHEHNWRGVLAREHVCNKNQSTLL